MTRVGLVCAGFDRRQRFDGGRPAPVGGQHQAQPVARLDTGRIALDEPVEASLGVGIAPQFVQRPASFEVPLVRSALSGQWTVEGIQRLQGRVVLAGGVFQDCQLKLRLLAQGAVAGGQFPETAPRRIELAERLVRFGNPQPAFACQRPCGYVSTAWAKSFRASWAPCSSSISSARYGSTYSLNSSSG